MSELKAIRGGDIHDLVEFGDGSEIYHDETLYYLKNAVDEDLAEKDKELRRQKYKRCLAMARWCKRNRLHASVCGPIEKIDFWNKWQKRWLELSKKFKEAK